MSTVQEIEAAIRSLPPDQREQLVSDLPRLLPELDGDAVWEKIINDPRPRPAFNALVDRIANEFRNNPSAFPEMRESDFDQHS